jgi:hypothetical protein
MLQTDEPFPSISSQKKGVVINSDTSVDVYFGPKQLPSSSIRRDSPERKT